MDKCELCGQDVDEIDEALYECEQCGRYVCAKCGGESFLCDECLEKIYNEKLFQVIYE